MDQKVIASLIEDMRRFFFFAGEINKAISKRAASAIKINEFISLSFDLGITMARNSELALSETRSLGGQFSAIQNACSLMSINIDQQKETINSLRTLELIDQKAEKRLMYKILLLSESMQKALSFIQLILERNNEMILLDSRLIKRREQLTEQVEEFSGLLRNILALVDSDLKEYDNNTKQRDALDDFLLRAAGIVEIMDQEGVGRLLDEIRNELRDEEILFANLSSRMDAADDVYRKVNELYHDICSIKSLIDAKDALYRNNLENLAQLSVILSLEVFDFDKTREISDPCQPGSAVTEDSRRLFGDLDVLFKLASGMIESLDKMNYDIIKKIDAHANHEEQLIELSKMEHRCYDNVRSEVDGIMKIVHFIAGGSGKNVVIGQILEKNLNKLAKVINR
ncbi:MAG: hypothetical protein A2W19_09995 [Spirochaetes bacterium RBG_16_49_21]|nr:MAG: hypothetical protein A2W19_09995 [Spirochaetes bacterium RBG_16_49_21]